MDDSVYLEESKFAVDGKGRFTSVLAYDIMSYLFEKRNREVSVKELSEEFNAPWEKVWDVCRQYECVHLVKSSRSVVGMESNAFQYNLNTSAWELQAGLEKDLLFFNERLDLEKIPVIPKDPFRD